MRKKIWEIPDQFHCSILGCCLLTEQVRIILKKNNYTGWSADSDYKIHGKVISAAAAENKISILLNQSLDRTASREIKELQSVSESFKLIEKWLDVKNGSKCTRYYWAIMSHPLLDNVLMKVLFGDFHILTHTALNRLCNSEKENKDLVKKNIRLKEKIETYKKELEMSKNSCISSESSSIEVYEKQIKAYEMEINKYDHKTGQLENDLQEKLFIIKKYEDEIKKINRRIEDLEMNEMLREEKMLFLKDELQQFTSGTSFDDKLSQDDECACFDDDKCKYKKEIDLISCSVNLENKTVLLVGGRKKIKEYCREIVETGRGIFIHHDGGLEDSKKKLSSTAHKADIVICALDCISHSACKSMKRMCKKENKNILYLKNTAVNTLSEQIRAVC